MPHDQSPDSWKTAFSERTDLDVYGSSSLGLFALALRFGLDDLHTVAADALTDGVNDKNCDIVFVDRDDRRAVICQCYTANANKTEAPANKAASLNTAITWLLGRELNVLPARLRPMATELRQALTSGHIDQLHVWYVHNLPECENVKQELLTVEAGANAILRG